MAPSTLVALTSLLGLVASQHVGNADEVHPKLTTWKCTKAAGCVSRDTSVVLDALAHPVYQVDNPSQGCGDWGSAPPSSVCPDAETCQENCAMDGVTDYSSYGIATEGSNLKLNHFKEDGSVASPRVYLLAEGEKEYEMLQLTGNELTFEVDVSKLPCGMNGALYLSEMEADGGLSDLNKAGAYYGTGYCDAQCYTTPFINGEPNIEGYGSCCNEMDIWEANGRATHLAPHPCNKPGVYKCEGAECQMDGICDKNGCGYNPYRVGQKDYYGPEMVVDTSKPFTVVTQFPADAEGNLKEIHRLYIQDGKVIQNAQVNVTGVPDVDFLDDEYCEAVGSTKYMDLGATARMGGALSRGMVLAFSIWWDEGGHMTWLDGETDGAGPCKDGEGSPDTIRDVQPDTTVTFSNIKWGEIGSTFQANSTGRF